MFLTLKNEKTLKKMRSKTLKNNIFFILGRNLIIRSFEIPHSIWKLHKDFKSVFVFKFRQKTKKFTPKWQKPLFEKRVVRRRVCQPQYQNTTFLIFLLWLHFFCGICCQSYNYFENQFPKKNYSSNLCTKTILFKNLPLGGASIHCKHLQF